MCLDPKLEPAEQGVEFGLWACACWPMGVPVADVLAVVRQAPARGLAKRRLCFSQADDVMLANPFGPAVVGWDAASERMDFASSRMHDGDVSAFEEVARYQSGDLVVLHETEHWTSRVADRAKVEPFILRVTTTFRREDGEWKIVHRHADPIASVDPHGPLRRS